jgi:hypothetical protein
MRAASAILTAVLLVLLVAPPAARSAPEPARPADSFVDSIGVATHYNYDDTPYGNFAQVESRLAELGVRHIRDGSDRGYVWDQWKGQYDRHGIKVTAGFFPASYWDFNHMRSLMLRSPQIMAGIEGPNEPDVFPITYTKNGTTYQGIPAAKHFQDDLYALVRAEPGLANVPILSPALAFRQNVDQMAPLSSFDVIAMHSYPGGQRPTNALDENIAAVSRLGGPGAPPKPIVATETGYHTALGNIGVTQAGVSEAAQAKYLPRLFAEYFNRGVTRTFAYELLDEGSNQDNSEKNFGLLRSDYSPKPAFTALKNTIALLEDPGPAFTPGSLDYTITAATADLHHTLLQKRDGDFFLALWREVQSFDTATKQDIVVHDVPVTLTLNTPTLLAQTYLPNESALPTGLYPAPSQLNLGVGDEMLLVRVTAVPEPATSLIAAAAAVAVLVRRPKSRLGS